MPQDLFQKYAQNPSPALKNQIFMENRGLVPYVLYKHFGGKKMHPDTFKEAQQEGNIGLLEAIDKYDCTLGYKFSTYAVWWIRSAVQGYLTDSGHTIRIPQNVYALEKQEEPLSERQERTLKSAEQCRKIVPLETPVSKSNGDYTLKSLGDTLVAPENPHNIDHGRLIRAARLALRNLPEKQKTLVLLRYGVITEEDII